MFSLRIPLESAVQLFGNSAQKQSAGCPVCHIGIADGLFTSANAVEEIARVAFGVIQMNLIGPKRFSYEVRWVGHQGVAIHRNAPRSSNKAGPSFAPDRFIGIRLAVNDDAARVTVAGAVIFHENLHRAGTISVSCPLHDVVVVLSPIEFADIETVRAGASVVRQPRRWSEIQVPVEAGRHGFGWPEAGGPKDPAAIPVGVNLFEFPDAAAPDEFTGAPEFAFVLAALLCAGLIDTAIRPHAR